MNQKSKNTLPENVFLKGSKRENTSAFMSETENKEKALKYLETSQIIPSKGMSYTMYEIEGADTILRMLTFIPDNDEIHIYPKPPVKKLYKPELCRRVEDNEFLGLWTMGEERKKV